MVDLALDRASGSRIEPAGAIRARGAHTSWGIRPSILVDWSLGQRLLEFIPQKIRSAFEGPRSQVAVENGSRAVMIGRRRNRPIEIVLDPELILTDHLTLPYESRRDIRAAVTLRIESETPFSIDEVLVRISRLASSSPRSELSLKIDVTPIAPLNASLRQLKLAPRKVRTISIRQSGGPEPATIFQARSPAQRLASAAIVVLPFLILGGVATAEFIEQDSRLGSQIAALEAKADKLLVTVKSLQAELDARQQASAGRAAYETTFAESPPTFLLLNELKHGLSASFEVVKIDVRNGVLNVGVRSANVLAVVAEMNRRQGWKAAVDGSISSDPANSQETATIALRISL